MQQNKRLTPILYIAVMSFMFLVASTWILNNNLGTTYKQKLAEAAGDIVGNTAEKPHLNNFQPPTMGDSVESLWLPLILNRYSGLPCDPYGVTPGGVVTGTLRKWHPTTISFSGPFANESDINPNPFLDYRLQVFFVGPSGVVYNVPGFFAGDGQGNGDGNIWQVRFSPDEIGTWHYCSSFRTGSNIAIEIDEGMGNPVFFDGASGNFNITQASSNGPGFLGLGRLEYANTHYLKFRDGPYWIKGGSNSPENFIGYEGFDNTVDQGGVVNYFLHQFSPHRSDWKPGDPNFVNEDGTYDAKGIIGALNYLGENHVNSIYFLPMNLGGDGQETYPFINTSGSHFDNTHYDISKLYQWNMVFEHAQKQGIALQMVLNEYEDDNRLWLDNGTLGIERKLFYRELVARFSYLLALKWNISEESFIPYTQLYAFANYLAIQDWANHVIAVHTPPDDVAIYTNIMGSPLFSATSFQYSKTRANEFVEYWRTESTNAGRPWVVDMDENNPPEIGLADYNVDELRKEILYDVYFSGGNIEWYAGYYDLPLGGDLRLEDFRTRETMWEHMWYARRFLEQNLPFWEMDPADELLVGESGDYGGGEVFAKAGVVYAIYLPRATVSGNLLVGDSNEDYSVTWYNPRTGDFIGNGVIITSANDVLALNGAPYDVNDDWVILVVKL